MHDESQESFGVAGKFGQLARQRFGGGGRGCCGSLLIDRRDGHSAWQDRRGNRGVIGCRRQQLSGRGGRLDLGWRRRQRRGRESSQRSHLAGGSMQILQNAVLRSELVAAVQCVANLLLHNLNSTQRREEKSASLTRERNDRERPHCAVCSRTFEVITKIAAGNSTEDPANHSEVRHTAHGQGSPGTPPASCRRAQLTFRTMNRLALAIGQTTLIEHSQEESENVGMSLLDLSNTAHTTRREIKKHRSPSATCTERTRATNESGPLSSSRVFDV